MVRLVAEARDTRATRATPTVVEAHAGIACLGRLAELYDERREQLAASVGLTDQQWGVLEEIATEHFMPSLFARRRESSQAAVSKILRQIVDKGLASATVDKSDARQRRYSLTTKGKRVMDRLREKREAAVRQVWLTLDRNDLRSFTSFSQGLIARLERYAAAASPERRVTGEE